MAKGDGSIGGLTPAKEGGAIERQWDEDVGGKGAGAQFPSPDAALPGQRMAERSKNQYPTEPPGGGEGDGMRKQSGPKGKPASDVSGFAS